MSRSATEAPYPNGRCPVCGWGLTERGSCGNDTCAGYRYATPLPPNVHRYLDLHVRHLPAGMVDNLVMFDGVLATEPGRYGTWCWVPGDVDGHFADYDEPPDELLFVLQRARALDCEFVRFDHEGPADQFLPMFP